MSYNNLQAVINLVLESIDKLPDPPREKIKKEFTKLKEMIMDNRPPRILVLGRRGAGKSSLINAILNKKVAKVGPVVAETGEPEWYNVKNTKGSIKILDTRGLGERSKPESAKFKNAIDGVTSEIERVCPDVILFLCKAKEVDARITKDIEDVIKIRESINSEHNYDVPVAALVTQIDELDPKLVEPPYEDSQKQDNIHKAVNALQDAFEGSSINLLKVIPVSAYAEYDKGSKTYDNYWNIDVLIEYLLEVLPGSAQLQLARISSLKKTQQKFARVLVHSTATVCAGIASTPIPVADIIPITSAQIGMITGIAYLAGKELSKDNAKEFFVALGINVGSAFALREAARALIKYVFPGGGYLVSAGMAYAGTWGIGEAAIAYFIDEVDIEEAKKRGKKARQKSEKGTRTKRG